MSDQALNFDLFHKRCASLLAYTGSAVGRVYGSETEATDAVGLPTETFV